MPVSITYRCGGCDATATVSVSRKTTPLFKTRQAFIREGGLCSQEWPSVEKSLPDGWGICILGCVYCRDCFAQVNGEESNAEDHGPPRDQSNTTTNNVMGGPVHRLVGPALGDDL
jgi:hypothetical protein